MATRKKRAPRAAAAPPKPRAARRADGTVDKYEPTDALRAIVAAGAACGLTHDSIALAVGCARNTLAKHYPKELALGKSGVEAKLAGKLFQIAHDDGNRSQVAAIMALLNNKFGWKPAPQELHHKGRVQVSMNLDYGASAPARGG